METLGPHVRTIPVRCAPSQAPCPDCGRLGRRKAIHHRRVRTIAYKRVVYLDVTYGEYDVVAARPSAPPRRASSPRPSMTIPSARPSSTASSTTA
jgi:hypothetical protein